MAALCRAVSAPLAVKLPPQLPLPLSEVAAALLEAGAPAAVCHNAATDGGPSQARSVLHASGGKLDVIGVGSVSTAAEALAVLQSGIKAVQMGSAVVTQGVGVFARLRHELTANDERPGSELAASCWPRPMRTNRATVWPGSRHGPNRNGSPPNGFWPTFPCLTFWPSR